MISVGRSLRNLQALTILSTKAFLCPPNSSQKLPSRTLPCPVIEPVQCFCCGRTYDCTIYELCSHDVANPSVPWREHRIRSGYVVLSALAKLALSKWARHFTWRPHCLICKILCEERPLNQTIFHFLHSRGGEGFYGSTSVMGRNGVRVIRALPWAPATTVRFPSLGICRLHPPLVHCPGAYSSASFYTITSWQSTLTGSPFSPTNPQPMSSTLSPQYLHQARTRC